MIFLDHHNVHINFLVLPTHWRPQNDFQGLFVKQQTLALVCCTIALVVGATILCCGWMGGVVVDGPIEWSKLIGGCTMHNRLSSLCWARAKASPNVGGSVNVTTFCNVSSKLYTKIFRTRLPVPKSVAYRSIGALLVNPASSQDIFLDAKL